MTRNNKASLSEALRWNEFNLNPFSTSHWRASLVPAAAVIPAPIAYIKVVAVKKLVVGFLSVSESPLSVVGTFHATGIFLGIVSALC